jgi:hypothetical protein
MRGTVSLALRIFTLALLLGWQAVAVGASGAHFCQKQAESRSDECRCPHGELLKDVKASHGQPELRMDCCDEPGWERPPPTFADLSSHSLPAAPAPASPVIRPSELGRLPSFALWETPRAQGPPVFLRIRTLLI